jgi:hypothetical protein
VAAGFAHGADEFDGYFIRRVNDFKQHVFAWLNTAGVLDEIPGKLSGTRIGHGE